MARIVFYESFLDMEQIDRLAQSYYHSNWSYKLPDILPGEVNTEFATVVDPNGKKWTLKDCIDALSKKLEFGNRSQIEAKHVIRFLNILYCGCYLSDEDFDSKQLNSILG